MGLFILHRRLDNYPVLLGLHAEFRRGVGYNPGVYLALWAGNQLHYPVGVRNKT